MLLLITFLFLKHPHSCTGQAHYSLCNKNKNSALLLDPCVYRDKHSCTPICFSSIYDTTTGEQVEAAIYTTKVILLKFFNLFDLNSRRSGPIEEVPWTPPYSSFADSASTEQLPSTQEIGTPLQVKSKMNELIGLILGYESVCFTISQVSKS